MSLGDFGAASPPPITTPSVDDQGLEVCNVCETHLDVVETAVLEVPVSAIQMTIADVFRRFDVETLRSRGDTCPSCGALYPQTVSNAQAHGWNGHVGVRVERADGQEVWVPVRLEDFPAPLREYINHVREDGNS